MDELGDDLVLDSLNWISLTPAARRPGYQLFIRRSAIVALERKPDEDRAQQGHFGPSTMVTLAGSDFRHLVKESPEEIIGMLEERR